MTLPRRKRQKTQSTPVPAWQIEYLTTGERPESSAVGYDEWIWYRFAHPHKDCGPAKKVWERLGKQITSAWIKKKPGTRPFGWWRYETTETRRQTEGPLPPPASAPPEPRCSHFGIPLHTYSHTGKVSYETELDYLIRNRLLAAKESKSIAMPNLPG